MKKINVFTVFLILIKHVIVILNYAINVDKITILQKNVHKIF